MSKTAKQLKITKAFRRIAKKTNKDCNEFDKEMEQLKQKLQEKQTVLFQKRRNRFRHKVSPCQVQEEIFHRPRDIVLKNSIETLKQKLELMSMFTGIEVQSYEAKKYCSVVFHMQHDSPHEVKHGLKIDMSNGIKKISASSLPLGFNLSEVLEKFGNDVMSPACLVSIRKALFAYYDRLEQFQALKKLVKTEADLFKTLDGSHMEISFPVKNVLDEEEDQFRVVLHLGFRVYDIRPKTYSIRELDLPEGAADILQQQCAVFKKKPLNKAFKLAFLDGIGTYELYNGIGNPPPIVTSRRKRPHQNHHYANDDTFRPEDCSDQSDDYTDDD